MDYKNGRYIIKWVGGKENSGTSYCYECGETIIKDDMYGFDTTKVQRLNTGNDTYVCEKCRKTFGPYTHITVITDEFV